MIRPRVNDLDYLGACLHGRRSRLAEAGRLEALCHLRNVSELGRALYPDSEFKTASDFQRRLVRDLVWEIWGYVKHLEGAGADLIAWNLARFQVENIKVLVRGLAKHVPLAELRQHIVPLPHDLALDLEVPEKTESLGEFIERLPMGMPRRWLRKAAVIYHEQPRPFFLEGALDCGYLQELLARTELLSGEDKGLIKPLTLQEADTFHLMLAVRGKLHYGLTADRLLPLHVRGSGISSEEFAAMIAAPDLVTLAGHAVGRALDRLPSLQQAGAGAVTLEPARLEALAGNRFLRLANRAFRQSHMGLGAVAGYLGLRRVEVANFITLSEGLRTGVAAGEMRARLIPSAELERAYV